MDRRDVLIAVAVVALIATLIVILVLTRDDGGDSPGQAPGYVVRLG